VEPVAPFRVAEPDHQDYLERCPNGHTRTWLPSRQGASLAPGTTSSGRLGRQGATVSRLLSGPLSKLIRAAVEHA
jgi:hypothetical protein